MRAEAACTVFADATSGRLLKQEGVCNRRITPASTFKIAISLMGYDAGFLQDELSPALPFREGYPDWIPAWKGTTTPSGWMQHSVVWYSQQITQSLGEDRFRAYVHAFNYGNADVSGAPGKKDGLTRAWLSSSLKISPLEQVDFLKKLVRRELPVSAQAYAMTSQLTAIHTLPNGWTVHGKTGAGAPTLADGSQDWDHAYGWFVGWAVKGPRTLVFVRQIQDQKKEAMSPGLRTREAFLQELPSVLDAM